MKVLVPASYDPITLAHMNLIERCCSFASDVIVCVANNSDKNHLFTLEERFEMINEIFKDNKKVKVIINSEPMVVHTAIKEGANVIIRGLRAISDFEFELTLNQANRTQVDEVQTLFLMTDAKYSFISSTMVKQLAKIGGKLEKFIHPIVIKKLEEKYNDK